MSATRSMIVSREISGTYGLSTPLLIGRGSRDGGGVNPCRNVLQRMQLEPDDGLVVQPRQLEFSSLWFYQFFSKAWTSFAKADPPATTALKSAGRSRDLDLSRGDRKSWFMAQMRARPLTSTIIGSCLRRVRSIS